MSSIKTSVVVEYPMDYTIDTMGTFRSISSGKTLRPRKSKQGYLDISTTKNGKPIRLRIAREVLKAFDRLPGKDEIVIYKDGDYTNCCLSNLRWGFRPELISS
jgi:hypothetical protein